MEISRSAQKLKKLKYANSVLEDVGGIENVKIYPDNPELV